MSRSACQWAACRIETRSSRRHHGSSAPHAPRCGISGRTEFVVAAWDLVAALVLLAWARRGRSVAAGTVAAGRRRSPAPFDLLWAKPAKQRLGGLYGRASKGTSRSRALLLRSPAAWTFARPALPADRRPGGLLTGIAIWLRDNAAVDTVCQSLGLPRCRLKACLHRHARTKQRRWLGWRPGRERSSPPENRLFCCGLGAPLSLGRHRRLQSRGPPARPTAAPVRLIRYIVTLLDLSASSMGLSGSWGESVSTSFWLRRKNPSRSVCGGAGMDRAVLFHPRLPSTALAARPIFCPGPTCVGSGGCRRTGAPVASGNSNDLNVGLTRSLPACCLSWARGASDSSPRQLGAAPVRVAPSGVECNGCV